MTKFDSRYNQPMLENLVKTRGWGKVKFRPIELTYPFETSAKAFDWIIEHCTGDAQYVDGYLYFSKAVEATAFALVWCK